MLNVYRGAFKFHNGDVKLFRLTMVYNSEFFTVDWFSLPLVEKCCHIHYGDEMGISYLRYYVNLSLHQVDVFFYNDIKNMNVDN